MRVALVLDVTGSMADDGKMNAMKPAAKALVDQLSALATTMATSTSRSCPSPKTSMMGASFKDATWIDWTDWDANNGSNVCTARNASGNCTNRVWTPNSHNTWTGCFTDRTRTTTRTNTAPTTANTSTLFPAEQYSYCDTSGAKIQPIMPLSYDWTALKTKIDTLVPTGNTNQGIGLAWGWMTLSQSDPFNAPAKDPNFVYKDAIVILSDGLNTQNRWYSERRADRRAAEDPVRQCQGRQHHDLHGAGEHRRRSDLGGAAILRAEHQQLLPGHLGLADGVGVQPDRHPALQAARLEISARSTDRQQKSPARAGLFHFDKSNEDQFAAGVNFETRPSTGLKVCLARSP